MSVSLIKPHRAKRNFFFVLVLFLFLLPIKTKFVEASVVVSTSFNQVVQGAELIFEGRVLSKETRPSPINGMPFTYFTFQVNEVIKGYHEYPTIEIGFMGGQVGDLILNVSDMRMPSVSERGIYFVETLSEQQVHPLVGWQQGHYIILTNQASGLDLVIPVEEFAGKSELEMNYAPELEGFKQNISRIMEAAPGHQRELYWDLHEVLIRGEPSAYSLFGASWPGATATIYSTGGDSNATYDSAFVEALNNWNNLSNFVFVDASGYKNPCANPNNYGPPWFSGYSFRSDYCGTAFGGSTLAVNLLWISGSTIAQAGTVFNDAWSWDVHSGSGSNIDFRRVATHEVGHALGLGHDNTYSALMNTTY